MTYQGIARVHKPNWFPEDRERLEKVLLELWPNSKINPRKMVYYIDNVRGFYPEIVQEAIGIIVSTQENDRRPTINQLKTKCRELVRMRYTDRNPGSKSDPDCKWCGGGQNYVWVGLYVEPPEKCAALDITGKNVLQLGPDRWAVRPDWGKELELNLEQYMVFCPHCSDQRDISGSGSALRWNQVFYHFTEFECIRNGNTVFQLKKAYTLFHRMISPVVPPESDYEEMKKAESRFHKYLETLPKRETFKQRKMNVIGRNDRPENIPPAADESDGRRREEEEEATQGGEATQGEILPTQDEGLSQETRLPSGDSGEDSEDCNERRQG